MSIQKCHPYQTLNCSHKMVSTSVKIAVIANCHWIVPRARATYAQAHKTTSPPPRFDLLKTLHKSYFDEHLINHRHDEDCKQHFPNLTTDCKTNHLWRLITQLQRYAFEYLQLMSIYWRNCDIKFDSETKTWRLREVQNCMILGKESEETFPNCCITPEVAIQLSKALGVEALHQSSDENELINRTSLMNL